MAEAAVRFLLDNLDNIFLYNAHWIHDLKDKLEALYEEFEMLKAYIKEYMPKIGDHETRKQLEESVRSLVKEAEETIDLFLIWSSEQSIKEETANYTYSYLTQLSKATREIQSIKETVKDICRRIYLSKTAAKLVSLNHLVEGGRSFPRDAHLNEDIMLPSYEKLPDHLKRCFLYLAIFPKNFEIPVWKLIRLWIAEGFLTQEGNVSLEDIAEEYLEELVDKNLALVGQRSSSWQIKTCFIPENVHELCEKEASTEILSRESEWDYSLLKDFPRLSVNPKYLHHFSFKPYSQYLRSFFSFTGKKTLGPTQFLRVFKLLRVLDIGSIKLAHFPDELCQLVLLKYIAIACNFKILPAAMSNLWNLQTLIMEASSRTLHIEADIWKMLQLRHLHTNASTKFLCSAAKTTKDKVASIYLQTLSTISPESCTEEVFRRTPNVKKLGIRGKIAMLHEINGESSFFDNLDKLYALENLKLLNDDTSFKLQGLPREQKFPAKLRKLTLLNTMLDWKYMSTLGKLDNLEVLKLKDHAFLGEWWQSEDGGFLNLQALHIGKSNLVNWNSSASHFPKLRCLILRHCSDLRGIPFDLADISTLQIIELYYTNSLVASSAFKIQQQKHQIQMQEDTKNIEFKLSIYPPEQ